MLPIFLGLVAAMIFGLFATLALGPEALLTNPWIDIVFWTLIAAGAAVSAINLSWSCMSCQLAHRLHSKDLEVRLCRDAPCAH